MMKNYQHRWAFVLLFLTCFTWGLHAQKVKSFPSFMPSMNHGMASAPQLSYDINHNKGVPMFAATIKDSYGPLHYVKMYSKDLNNIEKLFQVDPEDSGLHLKMLRLGAKCKDAYYGYLVNVFTFVEQPVSFIKVDFENKTTEQITYLKDNDLELWPTLYEMTYDHKRDKVWALGRNTTNYTSDIYSIDVRTGLYTKVAELGFYAWAIAVDYDGRMFTIQGKADEENEFYIGTMLTEVNPDDKFKKVGTSWDLKSNGTSIVPHFSHTMEFDHNSNLLYWLGMDNYGQQREYIIDVKNKTNTTVGLIYANQISSLYIPFLGADSREAAGKVTELKGVSAADNSLKSTITWKNPTTDWRGDNLTALHSVTISKGTMDNVVATLTTTNQMGADMSWEDTNAEHGINTYYIRAYRVAGEKGLVDSIKVFAGPDVPGNVENINVAIEGDNVRLSWEKPVSSATGKTYDEATLKYDVVRMPGEVKVATDLTANTFLDDKLGEYRKYHYVIISKNKEGVGESAKSNHIYIGKPYTPTFEENFENEELASRWQVIDNNQDGKVFLYGGGGHDVFKNYRLYMNRYGDSDDYLLSPPITLEAGGTYRVTTNVILGHLKEFHNFAFTIGKDITADSQKSFASYVDVKGSGNNEVRTYSAIITAEQAGTHYLGMHCTSERSDHASYIALDMFKIEKVYAKDLAVTDISTSGIIAGETSVVKVNVKNVGKDAQSNYKVQVINASDNSVLGETSAVPSIAGEEAKEVEVNINVAQEGKIQLAGKVILAGDENTANDQGKTVEFEVMPQGSSEWNVTLNGDKPGQATTEPMSFLKNASTTEFVYRADEINKPEGGLVKGIAFEYTPNDIYADTGEFDVKIYMGNTDKSDVYSGNQNYSVWSALGTLTMVYEGKAKIKKGTEATLLPFIFTTPFRYESGKNLVVQVWKEGEAGEMFPALFSLYDYDWNKCKTLRYSGESAFTYSEEFFAVAGKPVARLAITPDNAIKGHTINGTIYYNGVEETLYFAGLEASKVEVFDIMGRVVVSKNVTANQASVKVSLNEGVYIIKVVDNNGKVKTQKIALTK